MTGEDVREVCETILPPQDIARLCVPCGVMARPRTLPLGRLVRALVIAAGPPGGAYQADSLRSYLACAVPRVTRSACYRGFDAPLDQCLAALAERALADARAQQVELAGSGGAVKDWDIVDSTTGHVRAALREACPGTGEYAAGKGPTVLSGGCGAPGGDHFRPAWEHDSRPLQRDASWQGRGLLADRA
jgi:hypothetical protein